MPKHRGDDGDKEIVVLRRSGIRRAPHKYHRIYAASTWFPNSQVQTVSRHLHVPASRMID
jgi:hypothetical protein